MVTYQGSRPKPRSSKVFAPPSVANVYFFWRRTEPEFLLFIIPNGAPIKKLWSRHKSPQIWGGFVVGPDIMRTSTALISGLFISAVQQCCLVCRHSNSLLWSSVSWSSVSYSDCIYSAVLAEPVWWLKCPLRTVLFYRTVCFKYQQPLACHFQRRAVAQPQCLQNTAGQNAAVQ